MGRAGQGCGKCAAPDPRSCKAAAAPPARTLTGAGVDARRAPAGGAGRAAADPGALPPSQQGAVSPRKAAWPRAVLLPLTAPPLTAPRAHPPCRQDCLDLEDARRSYFGQLFPLSPAGIVPSGPTAADVGLDGGDPGRGRGGLAAVFHLKQA